MLPESLDDWRELAGKLDLLPGGAQAAIPDFFGAWLAGPPSQQAGVECWPLREHGELWLDTQGQLLHRAGTTETGIVTAPPELLTAAHEAAISPLLLTLLAIAVGHLDDGRRLKRALPRVDAAAKDLMLMSVCRLCG